MKLYKLLLLGLFLSIGTIHAQTDFRSGYIIKLNGDTLHGEIDYGDDLLMSRVCKFKDKESKITEYYPNEISAFRFDDSKYFVSREINLKMVFLEYLIKGQINIYYMRDESGDHYYFDKEEVKLTELPYEEGIKYDGEKQVFFQTTKHIALLNYYMKDAPNFQYQINSVTKPDHQSLIKLARNYHNAVCNGEKCIIYEKSAIFKFLPELVGGVVYYANFEDGTNFQNVKTGFYSNLGVIGHIWMSRSNEKMYFRIGVLFSQLDYLGEKRNFYKVPCQFEYIYPKGMFRPRFAYGFNFYRPFHQSVSLNLGGNIKLSKTIFISATSDIEFNSRTLIVPRTMLSYSLQVGLFLNIQ